MKKQELFNNVTEGFPYQRQPQQMGLYDAAYEHDACGVGMLVNIHGEKSHDIVESALLYDNTCLMYQIVWQS